MRSSQKQRRDIHFVRFPFIILLITVSLLVFLNGRLVLALILIFSSLAILIISTGLFTHFFLPEIPPNIMRKILGKAITQGYTPRITVIRIKDGKIIDDQTFPSKFKPNCLVHIDSNSVVICFDQKTGYYILHSGIHHLPRSSSLCAIFPTTIQRLIFGPESEDSLSKSRSGEGLADFHVRVNAAKRTAMNASDGIVVYAKFECFYKIDIGHPNEGFLTFFKDILANNKNAASILPADYIQMYLLNLAIAQWRKICTLKTSGQLIDETPHKLDLDQAAKNGLKCLVYVSKVFLEES